MYLAKLALSSESDLYFYCLMLKGPGSHQMILVQNVVLPTFLFKILQRK